MISRVAGRLGMHPADERAMWLSTYVLQHEPALRAWLHHRRVAGIDIDDIVQETYARLIATRSVSEIRDARNYVFQTAHSVLISYVRRSKIVNLQTVSDIECLAVDADEPTPEAQTIGRDELHRLARAIALLPKKVQDVFVLRRIRGLSQRETAKALGLSENTIEKYSGRSIVLLGDLFSYDGNDSARASKTVRAELPKHEPRRDQKRHRARD
jgi:RNA polymerase sigma-70 factor (ECF subfamily)